MSAPEFLYTVAEIRAIEQAAQAALPPFTLMQRAGRAAADFALEILLAQCGQRVLVLAGPGNNGGDALLSAAGLAAAGMQVSALLFADPTRQSPDSRLALEHARAAGVHFPETGNPLPEITSCDWALVIDGLFGIGLVRAIAPPLRQVVEAVNALPCPLLALDVPSGLDADTGNIVGEHGIAVQATHTLTFIGNKPGLYTGDGRDHAKEVRVAALDIDPRLRVSASAQLNAPALFADSLKPRAHNSHKGSYGNVIVAGGAHGMAGAVLLAARAAATSGAGKVFAAFIGEAPCYDSAQPELMCRRADDIEFGDAVVVAGPGLGMSNAAAALLAKILDAANPVVLDADALNLIAADPALQQRLAGRVAPTLLTPHPLEAARLLGTSAKQVQADRAAAARALAERFNAMAILKGSGTIIAQPGGLIAVNPTGNPALATSGTGDVLAGVCGALLAQSWPAWQAALGAVWLHGYAAEELGGRGVGPIGLLASELPSAIRNILNRLIGERADRRRNPVH